MRIFEEQTFLIRNMSLIIQIITGFIFKREIKDLFFFWLNDELGCENFSINFAELSGR